MYGPQEASTSIAEPDEWNEPCFQPPIDSIPSHLFMSVVGDPSLRENFASAGIAAQGGLEVRLDLVQALGHLGVDAGDPDAAERVADEVGRRARGAGDEPARGAPLGRSVRWTARGERATAAGPVGAAAAAGAGASMTSARKRSRNPSGLYSQCHGSWPYGNQPNWAPRSSIHL